MSKAAEKAARKICRGNYYEDATTRIIDEAIAEHEDELHLHITEIEQKSSARQRVIEKLVEALDRAAKLMGQEEYGDWVPRFVDARNKISIALAQAKALQT